MEKSDATRKRNAYQIGGKKIVGRKMVAVASCARCTQEARKKKREINRRLPVVVERNARDRENRQQRGGEGRGEIRIRRE